MAQDYSSLTAFQNSGNVPTLGSDPHSLVGYNKDWLNPPKAKKSLSMKFSDFNSGMSSIFGSSWGASAGNFLSGIGNSLGQENSKFTESQQATQSAIRGAISAIPVYGQIISAATGLVDSIGSLTGTNLSNINQSSADRLGGGLQDAARFNNAINNLPGMSMLVNGIGSIFGGGKTDEFKASKAAMGMIDDYAGTVGDLQATEDIAGKNLFGNWRNIANSKIASAKEKNRIMSDIAFTNTQRKASDFYQDLQNQNINRYAGQTYRGMVVGKSGLKLMSAKEAQRIIALKKEIIDDTQKLQNGGKIASVNESIMPTGALHKELHHLGDNNPELAEDITRKGIPVVTVNQDGELEQIAEVERSEWTLSKTLTDQIEELFEQWKKEPNEELEIQCGKLVVDELRTNTVDPGNQINIEDNGEE